MRVLVVGAGVSGCMAALLAADAGHDVTVLEAGSEIGGTLRDVQVNGRIWFPNCQYMSCETFWFQALVELADVEYSVFPHTYGSWSDLFGDVVVHDKFAQIVVPKLKATPVLDTSPLSSAINRLGRYDRDVSSKLVHWAKAWGDLSALSHENCNQMQLGRVFHCDDVAGTLRCKRINATGDALFGVPRDLREETWPIERAALPAGGWGTAFASIERALLARSVRIFKDARASVRHQNGIINVESSGESFESDITIWCANPNPLVNSLGLQRLDSPSTKMKSLLFEMEGHFSEQPTYWQIFSRSTSITRIFIYEQRGVPCLTIEAFDRRSETNQIAELGRSILRDVGIEAQLRLATEVSERRFALTTVRDVETFRTLELMLAELPIISGAWDIYGRDGRIERIIRSMVQRGLL